MVPGAGGDDRAFVADERVQQRGLAGVHRTDERDRDPVLRRARPWRNPAASVAQLAGSARSSPSTTRAVLFAEIVVGKIDPAFDLGEHRQHALLELRRDLAEPTAEVRLREPPTRARCPRGSRSSNASARTRSSLPFATRAPRELAGLREPRAALQRPPRATPPGSRRRRGPGARRHPRR